MLLSIYACKVGSQERPHAGPLRDRKIKHEILWTPGVPYPTGTARVDAVCSFRAPPGPMSRPSNVMKYQAFAQACQDPRATAEGSKQIIPVGYLSQFRADVFDASTPGPQLYHHRRSPSLPSTSTCTSAGGSESNPMHATKPYMHQKKVQQDGDDDEPQTTGAPYGCFSVRPG